MIEEKAVEEKEVSVLGKIEILILSDGNVTVNGPLKNMALTVNTFGKALEALAGFIKKGEDIIATPQSGGV
ncbi:MAG: hypothetical protein IMF11_08975 [Proteobacteria bacterium]|nr:hypothetical protein [Pseudomonadota bacterium]